MKITGKIYRTPLTGEGGFSLIELTMLIIIIGIITSLAMQSMTSLMNDTRQVKTKNEMDQLANAIVGDPSLTAGGIRSDFGYIGDIGAFPPNLDALLSNPGGYSTWHGPYFASHLLQDTDGFKTDEWGHSYNYAGGILISSTGSGSTITKKIANDPADYLINSYNGIIKDANDSLPGITYSDSIDISITIPNGTGGVRTKTCSPDILGAFLIDSLPVGTHPINIIYQPQNDTLKRYLTILPRHKSNPAGLYKFSSAYFGTTVTGGCSGGGSFILRPIGAGSYTELTHNGSSVNWSCVDEAVSDDNSTYVKPSGGSYGTDTYQTADPDDTSCTVSSITIHINARKFVKESYARVVLRTNGENYNGAEIQLEDDFRDYSHQWNTNPYTGSAWTWEEIYNMEIGVDMRLEKSTHPGRCTQVWVEIEYTD